MGADEPSPRHLPRWRKRRRPSYRRIVAAPHFVPIPSLQRAFTFTRRRITAVFYRTRRAHFRDGLRTLVLEEDFAPALDRCECDTVAERIITSGVKDDATHPPNLEIAAPGKRTRKRVNLASLIRSDGGGSRPCRL